MKKQQTKSARADSNKKNTSQEKGISDQHTKLRAKAHKAKDRERRKLLQTAESYSTASLTADISFNDVFANFADRHATKTLSRAALAAEVRTPRLVDTAPAPPYGSTTDMWLNSEHLECPVCATPLRRILRTQGSGGWHAILHHLTAHRAASSCEALEDAIAGAWNQALEVSRRRDAAKERAAEQRAAAKHVAACSGSTECRASTPSNTTACSVCGREFRANDMASLRVHEGVCRAKKQRRRELQHEAVEATQRKAQEARSAVSVAAECAAEAQRALRVRRQEGAELAAQLKEERRRQEKLAQRKKRVATSYYTPTPTESLGPDAKPAGEKKLLKAERAAAAAKRRLDSAKKEASAKEQKAAQVKARVEGEYQSQPSKAKSAAASKAKATSKEAFLPAHKRGSGWQPAVEKKGGKKQSKEAKKEAERAKTEAKKGRRQVATPVSMYD